jgi:hypothetical protein
MTPGDWIAAVPVVVGTSVIAVRFIMGMTRLVDSVDRLSRSFESIPAIVEDHERRLTEAGL